MPQQVNGDNHQTDLKKNPPYGLRTISRGNKLACVCVCIGDMDVYVYMCEYIEFPV